MSSKTNTEETIQTLKGDNQELMKENASLRRQIAGFKTSNYRYKKQAKNDALYVKSLQNDLEKCKKEAQDEVDRIKAYAKEADEMNEKKAEQIASLNASVEEKDRVIAGLQSQIAELNKRIANNEKNIQDLTVERNVVMVKYDYICSLPWYKRAWFNPNASKNAK